MISAALTAALHTQGAPCAGVELAEWVAASLRPLLGGLAPDATGLWVAAPDLGAAEAVGFWADARDTGLAFASPGAFPWTLSSALAGYLARSLDVRGPVTNFVGGAQADLAAVAYAVAAVSRRAVTRALVVGVVAAEGALWAMHLGPDGRALSIAAGDGSGAPPAGLLRSLVRAAASPTAAAFVCPPYGMVRLAPSVSD